MAGRMGLEYPFQTADEIMLKTMVRSNPGFVLIGHGDIIGKWGWRDFPDLEEVLPMLLQRLREYRDAAPSVE